MSEWTTPNEGWAAADLVPETELNNIGSNINYLRSQQFTVSGMWPNGGNIGFGTTSIFHSSAITIPANHSLVVYKARFAFLSQWLEMYIDGEDSAANAWTPYYGSPTGGYQNKNNDLTPSHTLISNASGSPIAGLIHLGARNTNTSAEAIPLTSSWSIIFTLNPL